MSNSFDGTWAPEDAWFLEETSRLGTIAEDGPELFGDIRDIEIDTSGRLWLIEGQAREIRVFNADGTFVRSFGRRGEGPGEFGNPSALAWSPDGTLHVIDHRLGRVSVFDTAGVFRTSYRVEGFYQTYPWPGGIDVNGFFYDVRRPNEPEADRILVRFDPALVPLDTISLPQHPGGLQFFVHTTENSVTRLRVPYSGTVPWVIAEDGGLWAAITDQYRLIRFGPEGDTIRIAAKPYHPLPVQSSEIDQWVERASWFGGDPDLSRIPRHKPGVEGFLLDDEGNVWVIPWRDGENRWRSAEVFDSNGFFLGQIELPIQLRPYSPNVIRKNTLAVVVRDSLDVPFVVRMAIHKSGASQ